MTKNLKNNKNKNSYWIYSVRQKSNKRKEFKGIKI